MAVIKRPSARAASKSKINKPQNGVGRRGALWFQALGSLGRGGFSVLRSHPRVGWFLSVHFSQISNQHETNNLCLFQLLPRLIRLLTNLFIELFRPLFLQKNPTFAVCRALNVRFCWFFFAISIYFLKLFPHCLHFKTRNTKLIISKHQKTKCGCQNEQTKCYLHLTLTNMRSPNPRPPLSNFY